MRAQAAPPPARRQVTLARGPGLVTDGAEVPLVAQLYDDVTVLSGEDATAGRVLSALDGAWLAHIAAHGRFRADSPLFSSLRMHDGPLTVYDFEQLHRAPYRLILSSCDSGVMAPAGANELLGLVSSLLPLGTAGVIASVVPLNDSATVPLMVGLHRYLRMGHTLAEAMRDVRCDLSGDPKLAHFSVHAREQQGGMPLLLDIRLTGWVRSVWGPAACGGHGSPCVPPGDQRCPGPGEAMCPPRRRARSWSFSQAGACACSIACVLVRSCPVSRAWRPRAIDVSPRSAITGLSHSRGRRAAHAQ